MAAKDFMGLMKGKTVDVRPSILSAEENIKSQLVVLDQLRDLIPPLTDEELAQLEQNILQHGVKDPLTIWETTGAAANLDDTDSPVYVLIDGHNRYRIIRKHQLDFRLNLVRFATMDQVKEYMINYQLGRRNLTQEQASYLRGMRYLQQKSTRGSNLRSDAPVVNVSEVLAKEYGVSSRTIKRDGEFAAGLEKLDPEIKHAVLAGKQKMPKSSVHALASPETNTSSESMVTKAEESTIVVGSAPSKRITALQTRIRKLANSNLDRQSCAELIQKTNELMALFSSK